MKVNQIEKVSISSIRGNEKNPRYIKDKDFNELVESVRKFPKMMEARPIIVDENDIILGGNMRYKAALELGYKEVHIVRITDATEEQKREFIIKDNVNKGSWDWDMLANEWNLDELMDYGLDTSFLNEDMPTEEEEEKLVMSSVIIVAAKSIEDIDKISDFYGLESIDMTPEIKKEMNKQRKVYVFEKK